MPFKSEVQVPGNNSGADILPRTLIIWLTS